MQLNWYNKALPTPTLTSTLFSTFLVISLIFIENKCLYDVILDLKRDSVCGIQLRKPRTEWSTLSHCQASQFYPYVCSSLIPRCCHFFYVSWAVQQVFVNARSLQLKCGMRTTLPSTRRLVLTGSLSSLGVVIFRHFTFPSDSDSERYDSITKSFLIYIFSPINYSSVQINLDKFTS